jgi:hypothetical protein
MRHVTFPELPDGREYMCIGPNCWGRDKDAQEAIRIAKTNMSASRGMWKFLLYDVPAGAWLDEMGNNVEWKKPELGPEPDGVRMILRYDPSKTPGRRTKTAKKK